MCTLLGFCTVCLAGAATASGDAVDMEAVGGITCCLADRAAERKRAGYPLLFIEGLLSPVAAGWTLPKFLGLT